MTHIRKTMIHVIALVAVFAVLPATQVSALRYVNTHADNKNLWLKEGTYNAQWDVLLNDAQGIDSVSATGNRIAYVDNNGTFWVKDGPKTAQWKVVASNVYQGIVFGDKVYVITHDFRLMVKSGDISGPWTILKDNTYFVQASTNRILTLSNYDGASMDLAIKEKSLNAPWVTIATPVATLNGSVSVPTIAVSDSRIAYIPGDFRNLFVKEGDVRSSWRGDLWSSGSAYNEGVTDNRICVNVADTSSNDVYCKDGSLNSGWVLAKTNAYATDILDDAIAVGGFGNPGANEVLEGSLQMNSGWKTLDDSGSGVYFSH